MLADLDTVSKRFTVIQKTARTGDKKAGAVLGVLEPIKVMIHRKMESSLPPFLRELRRRTSLHHLPEPVNLGPEGDGPDRRARIKKEGVMRRIAVVGLAGALLLSGVAMAATPQFYKGDTSQKQPILVYTQNGKVFSVMFDAEWKGTKKCQTLDGPPKTSTSLAFNYGTPELPIKHGKFRGQMNTDRHNFIDIQGTVTAASVTGSFTATTTFERVVNGKFKVVGPVCHTGTVTYTATRENP